MNDHELRLTVDDDWELLAVWYDLPECYVLTMVDDKGSSISLSFEPRDMEDMKSALELMRIGAEHLRFD